MAQIKYGKYTAVESSRTYRWNRYSGRQKIGTAVLDVYSVDNGKKGTFIRRITHATPLPPFDRPYQGEWYELVNYNYYTAYDVPAGSVTASSYDSYPSNGVSGDYKYVYNGYTSSYRKGSFIEYVYADKGVFPEDGRQGDYWYVNEGLANSEPTITLATTDNRTLYENDTIVLSGNAKDTDSGNVVTVKYNINGGTTRAIATAISDGSNIPFNKTLIFKQNKLYDGDTAITADLAEGAQHTLKVWAEDDQGGKSTEQTRVFYVVPNRPATLTINPFSAKSDLIDSDYITIDGSVSDPDSNSVTVSYKIANGSYKDVYNGTGGDFQFQVQLADLAVGINTITIQAKDTYGATTVKTLDVTKSEDLKPLLTSVARYKLSPPNGTAKGIVLWIEREVGDLAVDVEISMGANGEEENFVPMTKASTAFVRDGVEEDEWTFESDVAKENIIIKITMERASTSSNKGITLISGVLS